jgi:hypothetical protein
VADQYFGRVHDNTTCYDICDIKQRNTCT